MTLQQTCPKTVRRQETMMALKAQPFQNELLRPTQVMSLSFTQFMGING